MSKWYSVTKLQIVYLYLNIISKTNFFCKYIPTYSIVTSLYFGMTFVKKILLVDTRQCSTITLEKLKFMTGEDLYQTFK